MEPKSLGVGMDATKSFLLANAILQPEYGPRTDREPCRHESITVGAAAEGRQNISYTLLHVLTSLRSKLRSASALIASLDDVNTTLDEPRHLAERRTELLEFLLSFSLSSTTSGKLSMSS